jgi:arylsulfatase
MIENIDENIGRLLDKLDEWNLMDDTVIIFTSDNGMSEGNLRRPLGQTPDGQKLFPYNAKMRGLKNSPDEGGVRVPFFVRWDGHITPNRSIDRVAAHIDAFPTLAALAGAKLPEGQVEGRSLLPLIADEKAEWPDRYLFTHLGRWPVGADPDKFQWKNFAVRNYRFRLINNTELFDMEQDPSQTTNVIDQHPQVVKEMREAYDRWWKETRPLMVNEDAEQSNTRPFHVWFAAQQKSTGIPRWEPPKL